ncbi:MAG: Tex-like N-terminal domain-containing protein, partial [Candidatus Cryptobacteroides sp.]|nr:Tex-like N-terminal domain-containing protein [Candidatus Cryptobacteroides sp.]
MEKNLFTDKIARELGLAAQGVDNTIALLDEGCTIPFISRYRKERTGNMDEVQIAHIAEMLAKLKELAKRKETILKSIDDQGKLTDELKKRIDATWESSELEDIYLPYKPKRRTRAQIAR